MNIAAIIEETLSKASAAILAGNTDPKLRKGIDVSTGLVGYNLQAPAHQLVPLMSPFRQSIPRKIKPGAEADHWKNITGLAPGKLSVAENAASALFTTTVVPKTATFRGSGVRGQVTREAQAASQGFDPALAKETANALLLAMKLEEQYFLGANSTTAFGTPAAPTVAIATAAGSLNPSTTTYFAAIIALTLPAANRATIDRPADVASGESLIAGAAKASTNFPIQDGLTIFGSIGNSGAQTGSNKALKVSWTPIAGAAAYAVLVGTTTGAANMKCEAIVTQSQVVLTSLSGAGMAGNHANVPSSDQSADALTFDGIIAQLVAAGSGAYVRAVTAALTGNTSTGEVTEVQDAFQGVYDAAKVGKFRLVVGGMDSRLLTRLGVKANALNIITTPNDASRGQILLGAHVGSILNAITGDMCPVETAPWLPGGTIIGLPMEIPYPDANISAPFEWVGNFDWERWDYASTPSTGPIYPFEVRNNGCLEGLFTGGCFILYDIWKG